MPSTQYTHIYLYRMLTASYMVCHALAIYMKNIANEI